MKLFSMLLALMVSVSAMAAWPLPWLADGPKRVPQTLVITGNYKSPRLLAELIQFESRQPYLLLPAAEGTDTRLYMCLPKTAAREVLEEDLPWVVRQLNVRRIIVLGNAAYVQPRFLEKLDRTIPVIQIDCVDWNRAAEELGFMLNLSNLSTDYKDNRETMLNAGKIYRPVSLPAKPEVKDEAAAKPEKEAPATPAPATEEPVNKVVEVVDK